MREQFQVLAVLVVNEAESKLRSEANARTSAWQQIGPDYVAEVHERAAIMEFEGGLARNDAERRAMAAFCDRRKEAG